MHHLNHSRYAIHRFHINQNDIATQSRMQGRTELGLKLWKHLEPSLSVKLLLRLLCTEFRLTLRAAFSWMILRVRLFEAAGIDVSVNLRR
jgi:hypothetical protein